MPWVLLEETTEATESKEFAVVGPRRLPAQFTAPGLQNDETVTIQMKGADGTFRTHTIEGDAPVLTATNRGIAVHAPGVYRGVKSATSDPVSIELSTADNP